MAKRKRKKQTSYSEPEAGTPKEREAAPNGGWSRPPVRQGGDAVDDPRGDEAAVEGSPSVPFPDVGNGASAGGIEAFCELLPRLHSDTGMAFVYLQHQPPDRNSALTEILGRVSALPVEEAADCGDVRSDHTLRDAARLVPQIQVGLPGAPMVVMQIETGDDGRGAGA